MGPPPIPPRQQSWGRTIVDGGDGTNDDRWGGGETIVEGGRHDLAADDH